MMIFQKPISLLTPKLSDAITTTMADHIIISICQRLVSFISFPPPTKRNGVAQFSFLSWLISKQKEKRNPTMQLIGEEQEEEEGGGGSLFLFCKVVALALTTKVKAKHLQLLHDRDSRGLSSLSCHLQSINLFLPFSRVFSASRSLCQVWFLSLSVFLSPYFINCFWFMWLIYFSRFLGFIALLMWVSLVFPVPTLSFILLALHSCIVVA